MSRGFDAEVDDDPAVRDHLSELRRRQNGNNADRRVPIFL
jgi:hypothetical protein